MPAMKPGSGGPYSTLRQLRFEKRQLENQLENAPLGVRKRREKKRELEYVIEQLEKANAAVRKK